MDEENLAALDRLSSRALVLTESSTPGRVEDFYRWDVLLGKGSYGSVYKAYKLVSHHGQGHSNSRNRSNGDSKEENNMEDEDEEEQEAEKAKAKATEAVAIKAISKSGQLFAERAFKRIKTEINIMLQLLDHPNVPKLYETFEDRKMVCLVLELCSGPSLDQVLLDGHVVGEVAAAAVMMQLIECVRYIHSQWVCHRDIKPANVLFAQPLEEVEGSMQRGAQLKLLDFGLACQCRPSSSSGSKADISNGSNGKKNNGNTSTKQVNRSQISDYNSIGLITTESSLAFESSQPAGWLTEKVGTPEYAAPEVFVGRYDLRCDLYSCGIIMCLLLTGRHPFIRVQYQDSSSGHNGHNECDRPMLLLHEHSLEAQGLARLLLAPLPERPTAERLRGHLWLADVTHARPAVSKSWLFSGFCCEVPIEIEEEDVCKSRRKHGVATTTSTATTTTTTTELDLHSPGGRKVFFNGWCCAE